MEIDKQLKKNS